MKEKSDQNTTDADQMPVEPTTQEAIDLTDTTTSWSPRSLEASANAVLMKREGQPEDSDPVVPFAERTQEDGHGPAACFHALGFLWGGERV